MSHGSTEVFLVDGVRTPRDPATPCVGVGQGVAMLVAKA